MNDEGTQFDERFPTLHSALRTCSYNTAQEQVTVDTKEIHNTNKHAACGL